MALNGIPSFNASFPPIPPPNVLQQGSGPLASNLSTGQDRFSPTLSAPAEARPSTPAAPTALPAPQVIYVPVPVMQATTSAQKSVAPPIADEVAAPASTPASSPTPDATSSHPVSALTEADPLNPGEPTPEAIGQKLGNTITAILQRNPELVSEVDALQLDEPDVLLNQLHGVFHPLIKWIPNTILDKAVAQMPVQYQTIGGRLLDWFNTPADRLKSFSSNSTLADSTIAAPPSHTTKPSPHTTTTKHKPDASLRESDPFVDEEPIPAAEDKSLLDKLNPLNRLPGRRKEESDPFADLESLTI